MPKSHAIEVTVKGIPLEVEYDYYKGCRGQREQGTGIQLTPDEDPEIEINAVSVAGVEVTDLISDFGYIEEAIWDSMKEDSF